MICKSTHIIVKTGDTTDPYCAPLIDFGRSPSVVGDKQRIQIPHQHNILVKTSAFRSDTINGILTLQSKVGALIMPRSRSVENIWGTSKSERACVLTRGIMFGPRFADLNWYYMYIVRSQSKWKLYSPIPSAYQQAFLQPILVPTRLRPQCPLMFRMQAWKC